MTPETAQGLADLFLSTARSESLITTRVMKAAPPSQGHYRPHQNSRSTIELVWHLASSEIWFLDSFHLGKFDIEDDSMPADLASTEDIIAWYEDNFASKIEKAAKIPAEAWATPLPLFELFNHPMVLYLPFMTGHSVHHRGQLSAYLRPMGAKVPRIYGASFDEPLPEHSA
jgi:uncharacterized damage-inducible protein DinB